MPVAATQTNGETNQAIGSLARILYAPETTWGTNVNNATKSLRILGGESLDQNLAVYRSRQIRPDRMHNAPVLGSMDPGGNLPFELSPEGWNWALYYLLLPSAVTSSGPSASGVPDPAAAPTLTQSALTGGIPAGTYYYVNTITNPTGETNVSPVSASITIAAPAQVTATASVAAGGIGPYTYNLYRSTSSTGPFFLVATSTSTTIVDTNSMTGFVAPNENTTGVAYTYQMKAGTTGTPLPVGFSLEKGFTDVGVYELFTGCKIDKMRIDFRPDAIPSGTFDLIAQKFSVQSSGSYFLNGATSPPQPSNIDPYTGAYVTLYEGTNTLPVGSVTPTGNTPLGLCNDLSLNIDNAMYRRNGFIIGSKYRQNLKPGTRSTTFTGRFMFQDLNLYNKAIQATNTSIKIVCQSANSFWAHVFDLPNVRLTPNGSTPKVTNDGPIEIQLQGQALPDEVTGTDLMVTMVVPSATIN